MTTSSTPPGLIDITIDGAAIRVPAGTTVFDAARMIAICRMKRRLAFADCVSWILVRGFCRQRAYGRLSRE